MAINTGHLFIYKQVTHFILFIHCSFFINIYNPCTRWLCQYKLKGVAQCTSLYKLIMVSPQALSNIKLKKTSTEKDRSAPNYQLALIGEVTREKEDERRDYFFSTGLDRWYSSLEDKTFKTIFLNITPDEARSIIQHWEKYFKERTSTDPDPTPHTGLSVPPELSDLCQRIGGIIDNLSPNGKGIFVKLSTRSPKDSHVAFMKAKYCYTEKLAAIRDNTKPEGPSLNNKLIILQEAVINSLNVKTGEEAVQLLVSSTRVGEDLQYALEPGEEEVPIDTLRFSERCSLVLREWVDIPLWAEFRGFVWGKKLTSIGQYNHPVVFPQLPPLVPTILSDLEKFYETIKSQIPVDRYIIDFAWTPAQVYLVEINPFDGEIVFPASTGLWNWERDREQMMNGPIELRIRRTEQDPLLLRNTTDPVWRTVLDQ